MIIANPIYDVVFKYLLEDIDIAKGLLSTIIGEEIIALTVQPQEVTIQKVQATEIIRILRLDFKAIVRTETGETKILLIELQKARKLFDVMRFRHYLGENYKKGEDLINDKGEVETNPLPIITIYFLGFKLDKVKVAVVKVNRIYTDVNTGTPLSNDSKEPFIENLTHDCYVIQIPFLGDELQTQLQKVLRVFNQKFKVKEDKHRLNFSENSDEPLVQRILNRLNRAVSSEDIIAEMNLEDEVELLFGKIERQLEDKVRQLDAKTREVEEKNRELAQKDEALEALRRELESLKNI